MEYYSAIRKGILGDLGGSVGRAHDFGSGHDLLVCESEPRIGLAAVSAEPASDTLSPSLSLSAPPLLMLSLSKIKKKKKERILPLATIWMNPQDTMLSEISLTQTNTV